MLDQEKVPYKIYQEPIQKESIFANYGETIKDKEREIEARELENAEEEDVINEEW
ncbi:MAG: hypothetical protein I3273_03540 [Candidatus Moeniiplasma glomeromycotorum]|nr:hypothetical protein [Candidatus Moeniiplasma glomeromycotorum]MCE8169175.1 hypothetical protein [Candidatus Moeniiplasma glomeromycotorum]